MREGREVGQRRTARAQARLIDTLGGFLYAFTDERGVAVFENVNSGWCQVAVVSAPPAGTRWSPEFGAFNLGERDELGEIFVAVPD